MGKGIGCGHKIGKKNRQQPVITNGTLKTTSLTNNCHDTYNYDNFISYQEPITTKIYSIPFKYNEFDTNLENYIKLKSFIPPGKRPNSAEKFHDGDKIGDKVKEVTVTLMKVPENNNN